MTLLCCSEFSADLATVAGATVLFGSFLLATLVAVAVALRFLAFGFTLRCTVFVLAGIVLIGAGLAGLVALGHDERAIHKIGCGVNRRG